jgi:transketolase
LDAIDAAIRATKRHTGQPHLIVCRTQYAGGALWDSTQSFSSKTVAQVKANLDWPDEEMFFIPGDVVAHYRLAVPQGERAEARWRNLITDYGQAFPELLEAFQQRNAAMLPGGWETRLPHYRADNLPVATEEAMGQILDAIAPVVPELLGGTANLSREAFYASEQWLF